MIPAPWRRYAVASAGPVVTAGANFLLSLVLLRVMAPDLFGRFSFLLILSQFAVGLWSALFSAALPVILWGKDPVARDGDLAALFAMNLLSQAVAGPVFAAVALGVGLSPGVACAFAGFAVVSLLRQFARTHAYAAGRAARVMLSDMSYGCIMLGGLPLLFLQGRAAPGVMAAGLLALAAGVALLAFGRAYLAPQFAPFRLAVLARYRGIWKRHSGWSILGVITTEATMNSHAYIVTLFAGPAAFAVLSASSLLTRPVAVVVAALGEFERAHMAEQIARRDAAGLVQSMGRFRLTMLGVWLATAGALAGLLLVAPGLVFPASYPLDTLAIGAGLWMLVALLRLLRAPESAMMQGGGQFRPLAYASLWSALASVAGVAALLAAAAPVWSIMGVLFGDAVFAASLLPRARAWRRQAFPVPPRGGPAVGDVA